MIIIEYIGNPLPTPGEFCRVSVRFPISVSIPILAEINMVAALGMQSEPVKKFISKYTTMYTADEKLIVDVRKSWSRLRKRLVSATVRSLKKARNIRYSSVA